MQCVLLLVVTIEEILTIVINCYQDTHYHDATIVRCIVTPPSCYCT